MKGRSQQIVLRGTSAREKAVEDRMDIRALALIALTACALSMASTARAGEAEAVAVAVTSATGVTTTSTMIAEYAALESAYAAPAPSPVAETSLFDAFPRELTEIDLARLSDSNDLNGRVGAVPPVLMLEQRKLGPLVVEQPMRVYENDLTVKLRAPGGKSRIAAVEVEF